mgnify:CR=1 FL=1
MNAESVTETDGTEPAEITPSYVPRSAYTSRETIEAVREGLPSEALDWVKEQYGLSGSDLADLVHISRRTMSRRRKAGALEPDESERVLRLIRLFALGSAVLGGAEETRAWFKETNFALGEATPLQYADTEPGARRVERLLGEIDHGVGV